MKLSSRTEYAVRAMAELAEMHGGDQYAARDRRGRTPEIPRAALSAAEEGRAIREFVARGGYRSRAAARRIVGDIMRAVDGPIAVCSCAAEGEGDDECERKSHCAAHPVWARLQSGIVSILDSTTLYDMLAETPADDIQGNRRGGS